ncbi:isoprenylcysteine carboxylmethyltransferase family protein [Tropicibacter sp. R16_0]|uniref:methyltransferase family protein n=1 Tax=Tropicibacter sp. R16_0 TaxID=2821102 RepID=UPI001ADD0848|nr:isoprenylcysteine carboxylmethyltransferase family protein [Tropicibacter sp. R16_0]MBO9450208.1 isoprenylcysteine carboxylmethyltransferase family protein [Tropicibacter sp. R16_0]
MQKIDLPPLWLVGFAALAWAQGRFFSMGLSLDGPITDLLSGILIGAGLLLMVLAVTEMRRHQTTLWPHETAQSLVQTGIFKRTRNPIYLGDVLILAGLILRFDAVLALPLVPIFAWVLERRFVIPEENRLRRTFRADFARYQGKTRRWV